MSIDYHIAIDTELYYYLESVKSLIKINWVLYLKGGFRVQEKMEYQKVFFILYRFDVCFITNPGICRSNG